MDFDLALACADPTSRETELDHQSCETSSIYACNLCGDDGSDPRDAPCCGATLCAACIVSSAAGATGELRCPSCNSDGDYYVSYAAAYGALTLRPDRVEQSEDAEVARLRRELAEAKAGRKRAESETTQLRRELNTRPAKRRRAAPVAVPAAAPALPEERTKRAPLPRTVNGTGHTGPSRFCATSS